MALSMLALARECLNISGMVSARRDIFALRSLPPPRSLQDELKFIRRTRCRPKGPFDLRVTDVAEGKISVSWVDQSDNEDGFKIRFRGKRQGVSDHTGSQSVGRNQQAGETGQVSASLTDLRGNYEYTISVVAFNAGGESSPSNEVQATTPYIETKRVDLKREDIVEGPVPYAGKFPSFGSVPAGRLLRIRIPASGFADWALAFVKHGHSTNECNNASAVVVIGEGQTTTSAQLKEIYGVAEPPFTTLAPIPFIACYRTTNPASLPDLVTIEIVVIFDMT